jgi:phosphatidylserine/phosphatidylglycerophosphate/cardiolipin synthase-like enzyme
VTSLGRTIIVHAKLAIIDDVLLRIGSSNLNNRSLGFDTECDLSLEPSGANRTASRMAIRAIRTRLIAHWLGCRTTSSTPCCAPRAVSAPQSKSCAAAACAAFARSLRCRSSHWRR